MEGRVQVDVVSEIAIQIAQWIIGQGRKVNHRVEACELRGGDVS
jgi:hypothetical protein